MKYDINKISSFLGYKVSNISFDTLMMCIVEINKPTTVKIYGTYRELEGELVKVIIKTLHVSNSYITMKIEYGRRFKDIIVYSADNSFDALLDMYYSFIIEYIIWYNNHK